MCRSSSLFLGEKFFDEKTFDEKIHFQRLGDQRCDETKKNQYIYITIEKVVREVFVVFVTVVFDSLDVYD